MYFILFLFLHVPCLFADFDNHLRHLENKSEGHNLRNIDFIYLINLDQRPEKWQWSINQLNPFGIHPYRFPAVNGWELSIEAINDIGLKFSPEMTGGFPATCYLPGENFEPNHQRLEIYGRSYFCHCLSRGAIGIALSHISILQDALDSGYETIWVMEDDIEVLHDPRQLSDIIDELDALVGKENWDILFTDKDLRTPDGGYSTTYWSARRPDFDFYTRLNNFGLKQQITPDFIKVGARFGAHSMIVRRSGIKKLLQFFGAHELFFPYDMEYILPPGINLYTLTYDHVSNFPKALSDNGGPNYLNKEIK